LIILREIEQMRAPVLVAWEWDHRDVAWVRLRMMERMRKDPQWRGEFLREALVMGLKDKGNTSPAEAYVRELFRLLETNTVILAPAESFRGAAAAVRARGARLAERGAGNLRFFRIDGGEAATGVRDEEVRPLPTIMIPPTPTPIPLRGGPQIPLTDLKPTEIKFSFAEPRINQAWNGPPISVGGVVYDRGIGTHAWTRMTYLVPKDATGFQVIVGIAGSAKECDKASVTFELRDQNNTLLYDSGLVDSTMPPKLVHVSLQGATAITLIVTDGGNGIDCDHANWAVPAFLLPTRSASEP
jgi:hypothetical protein